VGRRVGLENCGVIGVDAGGDGGGVYYIIRLTF